MKLCIIPARGGSKRIPRKNIKTFNGRPLISWSISTAINSKIFDKVIVSTDDEEIAEISKKYGAEIPFLRPSTISGDHTPTRDVVLHSINWFEKKGLIIDTLCCIYATAPFIKESFLKEANQILQSSDESFYIFSATSFPFPIQRAITIDKKGYSKMINPEHFNTRSQDLIETYHDAGQFYFAKKQTWINKTSFFDQSKPFILPRYLVQDIDTLEDFKRAELMHQIIS
tara:strand:+ start:1372 stop:2055 length:684 start_codon:yes stop_codon:yes gene_type:complete